jgi:hypothetical protein
VAWLRQWGHPGKSMVFDTSCTKVSDGTAIYQTTGMEFTSLDRKLPSQTMNNERRDFYRVTDKVLLSCIPIDESSALANKIPRQFKADASGSLMRDLQHIDQENSKYLRTIADTHRELENYLKAINKKIELIASHLLDSIEPSSAQHPQLVSLSEGGLSFLSTDEYAHDSHIAMQLTLLPSHITLVLFAKVINCSTANNGSTGNLVERDCYSIAVSFINLKNNDRQIIAKHIIQLQLSERRQQTHEK